MKVIVGILVGLIILSFCCLAGYAEDQGQPAPGQNVSPPPAQPAAPPAAEAPKDTSPKVGNMTIDEVRKALGLSLYFQGGYVYNTRNPSSQENDLRVFDHKANSFMLDLAQIRFQKDADVGGLGYNFRFSFGETAKFIHSRGLGPQFNNLNPGTSDIKDTTPFDLTQAFVSYNAPVGKGLTFSFGKFVTMHGAEVVEAIDDYNYSRSFLFNYAIPFTHTGLKVYYPFSDAFNAAFYVVNGWDNTNDNNTGKTVGLSFNVTPVKPVVLAFNFMYGPEQDNNNSNERFLFDWVGTFNATKNLTFVVNTDYATEQRVLTALGLRDTKWYGIAGYAKYQFTDWFAVALRGEWFKDPDGVRTTFTTLPVAGTVLPTGIGQTLKEGTLTTEFKVAKNLILRPEYRHDWSDKNAFGSPSAAPSALPSGREKTQDTVSVGVMYLF
ncbi:MAG: porin [Syntrophorhabdales bacterium]|jgi:hypothetical protein